MHRKLTKDEAFAAFDIELNPEFPTHEEMLMKAVGAHSLASDLVTGLSRDDSDRELLGIARSVEYLSDLLAVQIQISYQSNEEKTITP
jgi:hypothetical protein